MRLKIRGRKRRRKQKRQVGRRGEWGGEGVCRDDERVCEREREEERG
jgi:hypothetical protein